MIGRKRILIVDDDDLLRQSLREQLTAEGFDVREAETAAAGLAALEGEDVDAVLLDIGLPDGDGRDVCRTLRARRHTVPVIMLTAADTDADAIVGLESGANDYVAKPFRLGVLLARLRAHIRQHEHSDDATLTIGPYRFQPAAKMLIDARNRRIRLTEKEAAILKYLYRAGRPIRREVLLHEVWGYNSGVTTHTLETHVYRLRRKIERDPARAEILVTEPGGYRLVP